MKARWTEAVETPIFASRNDPDTIPRPCFSSKHLNTPPPQHSLTGDGPFNALVTGIRQVDPLMRIDDDDEGAAEHVVPSEMMEFLATPFWPPDELRNVSAILEECDDATVQTTLEPGINTNRKRVLEELEPPIFSSVDDMMVGAKRQKHEHLSVLDAVHLAAPHIPADVAHQDMSENALDKEADLELERFFDFHAAALHNPLAGILDANWDMASSRTLPVPILPYPRPFHRTPDPWPSFPALLTTTLDVRSFNPVVSTEMSLGLFWNPVAALLRTGLANNAATADSGRSVVREILGKPFWGVDMQSKVIEVEGDHKFRVEDYVGSKKCEIGYDDEAPITPIRTLIPKRPTRSRKPALENIPHCQNRAASPAPLTKVQNPNEDVIAIDVEDETASDGNDHELQGRTEHVAATPAQMDDDEAFGYDTQTALEMLALEEDPFVVEDGDYEPRVIDVDELEFGSDKVDAAQEGIVEDAGAEAQVDMDGPEYGLGVVNKPFSVRASLDQFLRLRGKENMLDPVDPVAPPRPPRVLMERDEAPNSPQPATPTPLTTAYQQHQPRAFELPPFDRAAASRHTYIASQRVLNRRDLVRALEHDFNVDLIERDLDHRPPGDDGRAWGMRIRLMRI
ncbi:hypothetical protein DFJ77DRAFT_39321 [Powellomyces hirtus]|nr:hypothetical protein DFJ77DRAFT_39321 [Powellomyces hirtus]